MRERSIVNSAKQNDRECVPPGLPAQDDLKLFLFTATNLLPGQRRRVIHVELSYSYKTTWSTDLRYPEFILAQCSVLFYKEARAESLKLSEIDGLKLPENLPLQFVPKMFWRRSSQWALAGSLG